MIRPFIVEVPGGAKRITSRTPRCNVVSDAIRPTTSHFAALLCGRARGVGVPCATCHPSCCNRTAFYVRCRGSTLRLRTPDRVVGLALQRRQPRLKLI